jgi:hypothetical protein
MNSESTVMQKETIVKDDGRRLIYYRFVPEDPAKPVAETTEP